MTLHLLQGNIDNRNMGLWASSEKHPDSDRALHCLVFHTFGQARAPRSFIAIPDKDQPRLHSKFLAYSAVPADEMRNIALTNQTPVTAGIISPFSLVSSPLPRRVAPRLHAPLPDQGLAHLPGQEDPKSPGPAAETRRRSHKGDHLLPLAV